MTIHARLHQVRVTRLDDDGNPTGPSHVLPVRSLTLTTPEGTTTMTTQLDPTDPTTLSDTEAGYLATRPTKALVTELLQKLREADERADHLHRQRAAMGVERDEARTERDEWKAAHLPDPEAEALAGCVRAIEALVNPPNQRGTLGYTPTAHWGYTGRPDALSMPVGRILLALAARYGVPVEPTAQPEPTGQVLVSVPAHVAEQLHTMPLEGFAR